MAEKKKPLVRTDYGVSVRPNGRGKWLVGIISDGTTDSAAWGTFASAWTSTQRAHAAERAEDFGGFVVDLRVRPLSTRTRASKHRTR